MSEVPLRLDIEPVGPIVADAALAVICARGEMIGDALADIRALTDIIAAATNQLPDAINEALRHQRYSWDAIANALGVSRPAAIRRYARPRRTPLDS